MLNINRMLNTIYNIMLNINCFVYSMLNTIYNSILNIYIVSWYVYHRFGSFECI